MDDPTCETCKHWSHPVKIDDTHSMGECLMQMCGFGVFQGTLSTESCGDWQERDEE